MLRHAPTELRVKCQTTRQQGMNRFIARRMLLDKIEALKTGQVAAKQNEAEKIRRQKRRRSRSKYGVKRPKEAKSAAAK